MKTITESNVRMFGKRLMREANGDLESRIKEKLDDMDTEDLIRTWNEHTSDGNEEIRFNEDDEFQIVFDAGCNQDWGLYNRFMKSAKGQTNDDYFLFDQWSGFEFISESEARKRVDMDELAYRIAQEEGESFLDSND